MKKIYVIGSFKDLEISRQTVQKIEENGLTALISTPGDPKGIDGCLEKIDQADIIYVSNPRGEIGKSVSIDLGYAIAKKKVIFSNLPINDPPIAHHVEKVGPIEKLIQQ